MSIKLKFQRGGQNDRQDKNNKALIFGLGGIKITISEVYYGNLGTWHWGCYRLLVMRTDCIASFIGPFDFLLVLLVGLINFGNSVMGHITHLTINTFAQSNGYAKTL